MQTTGKEIYKIIFSDIDGTLLNKDRELSDTTIDEVKRITKTNQLKFILVSARMPSGINYLMDQLSISTPIVSYNGALILTPTKHNGYQILKSQSIDYDAVLWFIDKTKELDLHCSIYSNDSWITQKKDKWTLREESNTKTNATIIDLYNAHLNWSIDKQHIHKVMVMGDSDKIDEIEEDAKYLFPTLINIYRSKDTYLEISPKSVSKASACSFILDWLKIDPNESIAFGDNYNDIEMLSMVKLGVAMENAIDEVKEVANLIAPSNVSDGVAQTLKELFK